MTTLCRSSKDCRFLFGSIQFRWCFWFTFGHMREPDRWRNSHSIAIMGFNSHYVIWSIKKKHGRNGQYMSVWFNWWFTDIWCFGTWLDYDFPETVGNVMIPTDVHSIIFQRGRAKNHQPLHSLSPIKHRWKNFRKTWRQFWDEEPNPKNRCWFNSPALGHPNCGCLGNPWSFCTSWWFIHVEIPYSNPMVWLIIIRSYYIIVTNIIQLTNTNYSNFWYLDAS